VRTILVISLLLASCTTYRKTKLVREWTTTYNVVFTVNMVEVHDRRTDTLRFSRMDTSVTDAWDWKMRRIFYD